MAVNLDIILHLSYVNALEHINEALAFKWDTKFVINKVKKMASGDYVGGSNNKIVNLAHQNNVIATDDTRVEARFVGSGCKVNGAKYRVSMFLS